MSADPKNRWPFVTWMLGYPIAESAASYLGFLAGDFPTSHYSTDVVGAAAATNLLIWAFVGIALWRSK